MKEGGHVDIAGELNCWSIPLCAGGSRVRLQPSRNPPDDSVMLVHALYSRSNLISLTDVRNTACVTGFNSTSC